MKDDLPQEYEQIPWSQLVPVAKDRSMYLAALVAVIAAALIAAIFAVRRSPPPAAAALPATTTLPAPEVVPAAAVATPVPTTSAGSRVYSEADLMAVLPPQQDLMAIARAEWFVTDFFTVDGDEELADGVVNVLPDVVELPATDGSAISYVEWARAVEVADHADGTYDVTVWFRTLAGNSEAGFARTPVRAAKVRVVTDAAGRLAVADLPEPVALEPPGIAPAWPPAETAPDAVVAAGAAAAGAAGTEPELAAAGRGTNGWRLVFTVGDASGLRFPVVVWPGDG